MRTSGLVVGENQTSQCHEQRQLLFKEPWEDTQKSEKKCKAFEDISKYFSKREWSKLSHSEKITYVDMKRNYRTMTSLGLRSTLPNFMRANRQLFQYSSDDSDEDLNSRNQGLRATVPAFTHANRQLFQYSSDDSDEDHNGRSQDEPRVETSGMEQRTYLKMPKMQFKKEEPKEISEAFGSEEAQGQLNTLANTSTSKQQSETVSGFRNRGLNVWSHRLRERKYLVIYEEISDPEEEEED